MCEEQSVARASPASPGGGGRLCWKGKPAGAGGSPSRSQAWGRRDATGNKAEGTPTRSIPSGQMPPRPRTGLGLQGGAAADSGLLEGDRALPPRGRGAELDTCPATCQWVLVKVTTAPLKVGTSPAQAF